MAPAAYDTLSAFFKDTHSSPRDYDLILTGDLGQLGHAIVQDFFAQDGIDMQPAIFRTYAASGRYSHGKEVRRCPVRDERQI